MIPRGSLKNKRDFFYFKKKHNLSYLFYVYINMNFTKQHYKILFDCVKSISIKVFLANLSYLDCKQVSKERFIWNIFWVSNFSGNHRVIYDLYSDNDIAIATEKAIKELLTEIKVVTTSNSIDKNFN